LSTRLFAILAIAALVSGCSDQAERASAPGSSAASSSRPPESVGEWQQHRTRLDATVWSDEAAARHHEQVLVALWDHLLAARSDPDATLSALTSVEFEAMTVGVPHLAERLDHGIERLEFGSPTRELAPRQWADLLEGLARDGYVLVQSEWHHARFVPARDGVPARSFVSVVLHAFHARSQERVVVDGELAIGWSGRENVLGHPIPKSIDATRLQLLRRSGDPAFRKIFTFAAKRGGGLSRLHPILLYDLDRDGFVDIVSVGGQRVLWNLGERGFRDAPLVDHLYRLTEAAVIADLDGDANPDLLSARARGDLVLYRGDERGRFATEPLTTEFDEPLLGPSVLTVGDVDGDGDLDLWLGQYKPPYTDGQMPTPYYDANDGYPSYLLMNDGHGRFTEATEAAGLTARRFRRTYTSSFVDLDDDTDLDLLVVSDFSGIDLYHNDGTGRFADANETIRGDRHLFGMSASIADYNLDGRLDLFVAGMASTTARRLEALGLGREERSDMQDMRMRMAFGNRMYLADDAGWLEPDFRADVARTGWTWGTTAFDFDNDGDPDIFAANGHESGESTDDYCSNFWTHDIFDADSAEDESLASLFAETTARLAQGKQSWDGYQKNHLLMNRSGVGFINVAFLLGVADEFDSRSAVSTDIDRDGRVDLVVVEDLGDGGEKLRIYRNQLETANHWIGIELREEGGGVSPVGASVLVRTEKRSYVGRVLTGDTLMGQQATTLHFGLGAEDRVESIEVRWQSGIERTLLNPAVDRYHTVLSYDGAAAGSSQAADG
jgi:hypothetical protein